MTRISLTRRVVQTLCFAVVVFGGFLFGSALDVTRGEIVADSGYRGTFESTPGIRWVERESVSVPVHLPITSCYYQHSGLFSGCSLLFFSEHIAEITPLFHVLPHLLLVVTLMFVFGRLWCGWACPFGLLSDLLTGVRKLLGRDQWLVSRRVRDGLVKVKYGLLFATLGLSALAAVPALAAHKASLFLPFCQVCLGKFASPFLSGATICWTNLRDPITATLSVLGLSVFVLFFAGFSVRRLYCRICPVGGITAPFNRYGLVSLFKRAEKCTGCGACARVCPVDNLTVYQGKPGEAVNACECTLCLRCVESCPEPDCLSFTMMGETVARSHGPEERL